MMKSFNDMIALVPVAPDWAIDWDAIWGLWPEFSILDDCPQDPIHHGEGDVGTHTRMVVEALVGLDDWRELSEYDRGLLFWTACFHDIGKPATTKQEEDGRITSRGHSHVGAGMTRAILRDIGVDFKWREAVCALIMKHQLPFWLIERPEPARLAVETSLECRADLLCIHAMADGMGRICADQADVLENVALAREVFQEMDCLIRPFVFANDASRIAYLNTDGRDPHYQVHADHRCTAYVMSALPGSGKDTWVARNLAELPMVSLDQFRESLGIGPTDNQGQVIQAAYEQARVHLRAGQDFVWNATNVTRFTRGKIIRLLRDYDACIHIVYLEVSPKRLVNQNANRDGMVPHKVVEGLARKLEPPHISECHVLTNVIDNDG
jgi:putative nucleotidyltransferase with HDIG domain